MTFQPKLITSLEDIQDSLIEIQSYIEQPYNADNGTAVVERAGILEGYMAQTGKLLADAKWHYNAYFNGEFSKAIKEASKYSASTTNMYLKSICKDHQYLVDWTDRINAACTHQLDFSRTLISKLKAEMQNIR